MSNYDDFQTQLAHTWMSVMFIQWCQTMRNVVCCRSMSGKTCLRLVEMTGNFCQVLLYIQWCDR